MTRQRTRKPARDTPVAAIRELYARRRPLTQLRRLVGLSASELSELHAIECEIDDLELAEYRDAHAAEAGSASETSEHCHVTPTCLTFSRGICDCECRKCLAADGIGTVSPAGALRRARRAHAALYGGRVRP